MGDGCDTFVGKLERSVGGDGGGLLGAPLTGVLRIRCNFKIIMCIVLSMCTDALDTKTYLICGPGSGRMDSYAPLQELFIL